MNIMCTAVRNKREQKKFKRIISRMGWHTGEGLKELFEDFTVFSRRINSHIFAI